MSICQYCPRWLSCCISQQPLCQSARVSCIWQLKGDWQQARRPSDFDIGHLLLDKFVSFNFQWEVFIENNENEWLWADVESRVMSWLLVGAVHSLTLLHAVHSTASPFLDERPPMDLSFTTHRFKFYHTTMLQAESTVHWNHDKPIQISLSPYQERFTTSNSTEELAKLLATIHFAALLAASRFFSQSRILLNIYHASTTVLHLYYYRY